MTLSALGVLSFGAFSYALTPSDYRWGVALVRVEGGRSLDESRAVLGSALRRFAIHRGWKSFGDFVRVYEGGEPAPGSRRALIYAAPLKDAPPSQVAMVLEVMRGGVELAGAPAEHWAAPSMFARWGLDASSLETFLRTVRAAVRRRRADWRWVDVAGTRPPRSNVFVSTVQSRAAGKRVRILPPA